MSSVRLRYTGGHATTFQYPGVGHVEPGGEFEVPEGEAERFTRRADVELAVKGKAKTAAKAGAGSGEQG